MEFFSQLPPIVIRIAFMVLITILFTLIVWAVIKIINEAPGLEWYQLVSTQGKDGKYYADWNRIGQGGGIVLCMVLPFIYVFSPQMGGTELAIVMGASLLYLGGVSSYAASLRSKQNSVETTTITEASPLARTTETVLERNVKP